MDWYLIHTKPRQERLALLNLEQQGYECFLPNLRTEKLTHGVLTIVDEPLFPRYLFIRTDMDVEGKGWGPVRSTKGVSRLVAFGNSPAKISNALVDTLRTRSAGRPAQRFFRHGERVMVTDGPFAGIEAVYQMSDGASRVMVLIEMLSKPVQLTIVPGSLRKLGS